MPNKKKTTPLHPLSSRRLNAGARSLVVSVGVVALALSLVMGVGTGLSSVFDSRDVARAQNVQDPNVTPGGIPIPTPSNNGGNSGGNTNSGTTTPIVTPPSPQVPTNESVDVIGDQQSTTQIGANVTPPVNTNTGTQTPPQNTNTQALAAAQNTQAATPRSGGIAFVSAGIAIIAVMVWYYYFKQYSGSKAALKTTEKKIRKL